MQQADIEALVGVDLDRAIAQELGYKVAGQDDEFGLRIQRGMAYVPFSPSSDWTCFGPLMVEHRVALYPTMARGVGAGQSGGVGWMGACEPGAPLVDRHALTAGCRALLQRLVLNAKMRAAA